MMEINNWEDYKMVLKRALGGLFALAITSSLASGMLFAQEVSGLKVAHTVHSGPVIPAEKTPAGLKTIFSNLGPTASNDYNDTTGYYVLGPDNSVGDSEQWIGLPFTPTSGAHVEAIEAAIGYISGTSLVELGLYSDNDGAPGTVLASGKSTKIPLFGACCQLVTVTIPSTAIKAGTQYWIVATTNDTAGPDFTGVFQSSNLGIIGYNEAQGGWGSFTTNTPAAAVKGTIP
jgi:hypothetical protein